MRICIYIYIYIYTHTHTHMEYIHIYIWSHIVTSIILEDGVYIYIYIYVCIYQSVQSLSNGRLFATPWTAEHQTSQSITNSQNLIKFMFLEPVMPSNYHILCHPLLLSPSAFPNIRDFSNESALDIRWPKHWSFSLSISLSDEY